MKNFILMVLILSSLLILSANGQEVVVNEIMASNTFTLADEDGDYPDWIELYNAGADTIRMVNWGISDAINEPFKWIFPDVTLTSGQYLILFASDKDRREWIAYWDNIIDWGDTWQYFPGTSEPPANWKNIEFDDSTWDTGNSGFGYGDDDDQTVLSNPMISVFLRHTFVIEDTQDVASAILHIDYDDAFVAYLNGIEFARSNIGTPGVPPAYDQGADNYDHEARIYQGGLPEAYPVTNWRDYLINGENVLAIQVHNFDLNSSDMTCIPFFSIGLKYIPEAPEETPEILNLNTPSLHTNFKLSAQGESVYLTRPDSMLADSIHFGNIPTDHSYGRQPDGDSSFYYFEQSTPGSENITQGYPKFAEVPVFSHEGGFYDVPLELSLESGNPEFVIYYTLDGSVPDSLSSVYSAPISIDSTLVVRAMTAGDNILPSKIVTKSYLIGHNSNLPVICLTSDPYNLWDTDYGIYVLGDSYENTQPYYGANFWEDWERPVHVEFYEKEGNLGFEIDGGIKMHGAWSRAHPQKSFSIFARGRYGYPEINYPLFKNRPFRKYTSFILRNSANDWGRTQFADGMIQTLADPLDLDHQAYQPCIIYINGDYFGFLNMREKINDNFLALHHNIEPDNIDILEFNGTPVEGSSDHYDNLFNYISSSDLSVTANYEYVATQMDIDNFIDYEAFEIYIDNRDWPGNNIKFWRSREEGSRWRWIVYDTDWGFGIDGYNGGNAYEFNTLDFALESNGPSWPNPPWSTLFLRKLIENDSFKNNFINHFADQMNTIFRSDHVLYVIDSLEAAIESEIPAFWQKWRQSYPKFSPEQLWWGSPDDWYNYNNIMRSFAVNRPVYMKAQLINRFGLTGTGKLTLNVPIEGGRVRINSIIIKKFPWTGDYFKDVPVELEAIPAPGYIFTGWTGDLNSNSMQTLFNVNTTTSLTAHFEIEPLPSTVVINEINYHSAENFNTEDWVEIFYNGDQNLDISGWLCKDERDTNIYEIPEGTILSPGDYLVLCSDTVQFKIYFPEVENVIGNLDFGLSAGGDKVRIFDNNAILIDSVAFDDEVPWPTEADGFGSSLELINPCRDNTLAENWSASENHGTPGALNTKYTDIENDAVDQIPDNLYLGQNYPNPFNPKTIIQYSLPNAGIVDLSIFNILGQKIDVLVSVKQTAGKYKVEWDGSKFSSGIYFCRLIVANSNKKIIKTKKMMLLR